MPASKRMINHDVIVEKSFLELSDKAKLLYFFLNMNADNEGVVSTTAVMSTIGATEKELEELIQTGYVMKAYADRCIITHWFIHNSKPKAGCKPTEYPMDLALFELDEKSKTYRKLTEIAGNLSLGERKRQGI